MSWTDERIATLKKMWEGGSTASQIADELGGVSRALVGLRVLDTELQPLIREVLREQQRRRTQRLRVGGQGPLVGMFAPGIKEVKRKKANMFVNLRGSAMKKVVKKNSTPQMKMRMREVTVITDGPSITQK